MMQTDDFTLITGATGGLGGAFCEACAKRGENLALTGRSIEKLSVLSASLQEKYPTIQVRTYDADLSGTGSRYALMDKLAAENIKISKLINVAGVDVQKAFCLYDQDKIRFQCRTNFEAAVSLCHFAIEHRAKTLKILNISSVSGIYPMPYFAIYSATKSALTSFSLALREELKDKGVFVTALLPGAIPTREDIKQQIKGQGLWGKLAAKSPQFVAEVARPLLKL